MSTLLSETRFAKLTDVQALTRIHDETWRASYQGIIPSTELDKIIARRGEQWWQTAIERGNRIALLSFQDTLVGYVNYGRNRAKGLPQEGEVYELYIRPDYQGMGFGSQLFASAWRDLKNHKLNSLVVWVLSENDQAITFFKAMGGKPSARSSEKFGTKTLDKTAFVFA